MQGLRHVLSEFLLIGLVPIMVGCNRSGPSPADSGPLVRAVPLKRDHGQGQNSGRTLFTPVSSTDSGLHFINGGPEQERNPKGEILYFRSMSGADTSGGVTIGDVDGDGLPDVYLTRASGGNRLYRNRGGMRFEDVTREAGLTEGPSWGTGASFVDIDNDGDLDLYACGYDVPNCLYVNEGRGRFVERGKAFGLDFKGASVMMAFADVDLDGDLDGYLLTNHLKTAGEMSGAPVKVNPVTREVEIPLEKREVMGAILKPDNALKGFLAGQYDHLFRNELGANGEVRPFVDVSDSAGVGGLAHMGLSATWWDYNSDGYPDLYVANDFYGPDHLFRNNGDGTLTDVAKTALPHTPWFSMGSDFADVNNDGKFDYLASDMSGSTHYKSKMGMGDMDQEGWFLEYGEPRQYMRNALYLNTGTPRFMEAAYLTGLANSDWTWSVKFGDLDNDGREDVFITNGMTRDLFHSDLKARELQLQSKEEASVFWGKAPEKRDTNFAFRNSGDLAFEEMGAVWGLNHTGVSFGAALADLDGDGDLDLVVNHYGEAAGLYQNDATTENNVIIVRLEGRRANRFGVGATVKVKSASGWQTKALSLARGYMSTNEPVLHFGLEKGDVVEALWVQWPGGAQQVHRDLKVNHLYTIRESQGPSSERFSDLLAAPEPSLPLFASSDFLSGVARKEAPFDDFARQPLLPNKLSQLGPGLAWGDVDGDGDEDLYAGGPAGQSGMLYVNHGPDVPTAERFVPAANTPFAADAASEDMGCLFLDSDGDGDLDLYVVSGGVECDAQAPVLQDRLYVNDSAGGFQKAGGGVPAMFESGSVAAACDFDRDGDLDLFVGGRCVPGKWPVTPRSRLLRNDCGTFVDVAEVSAPELASGGMVTGALWSDVDNDGWVDLLVTHEWGPVKLYQNRQGVLGDRTQDSGLGQWLGWWNGIAGGDVDRDGDMDYVVTNAGLNTRYHASASKPQLLYYGDLDGSGEFRLVEAEYEGDVCYPRRGYSCSSQAMPVLKEQFKNFHDFASMPVEGLYGAERLSGAQRLEVNTLETGVLFNESEAGDPKFRFRALPRLAQMAPAFGVVLTDANADGRLDIVLAQNFYGPQRETGRMDGGTSLLLLGKRGGEFRALWPDESGIVVPGDAKALTLTDLDQDGRHDLIVGVNDGEITTFVNDGNAAPPALRVRLAGAPENRHGVGARVTLEFEDGTSVVTEVYSGSGYLSQSTMETVFSVPGGRQARRVVVRWPTGGETSASVSDADVRDGRVIVVVPESL